MISYQGEGGIIDIRNRLPREYGEVTLDADGNATVIFANPAPSDASRFVQLTPWVMPGTLPVIANPTQWIGGEGGYIGVEITGVRVRPLPNNILNIGQLNQYLTVTAPGADGVAVDWMLY